MLMMKEAHYKGVDNDIKVYLYDTFFVPLLALVNNTFYYNAKSVVVNALQSRRITYKNGSFKGKFNISISKELSHFATFDSRSKSWKVKHYSLIPSTIKAAILVIDSKNTVMRDDLFSLMDNLENRFNSNIEPNLGNSIGGTIDSMQKSLTSDLRSIGIIPNITPEMRAKLIADYNKNLSLKIQGWDRYQVERLRNMVLKINETGYNKESIMSLIEREWGISQNRARVIAKQETSLFLSKFRREQNLKAGVTKYKWSTSHDERVRGKHAELDGKVFFYGDPPITDEKGNKHEPGEDYGCRCVAIPVI